MAIQILSFEKTSNKDGKTTIKLHPENLNKVLSLAEGHPICPISICGPSRRGKSFLLGHIIRCLDAMEKGITDWMDREHPEKPLGDSFEFRNGNKPLTQGIWIWNKPFIITNGGQKIAVLLIDTEGTGDEYTSSGNMMSIVGLSLLLSSVVIFNLFTSLHEEALNSLITYIKYGEIALKKTNKSNQRPFQELMFLIREWNNPDEFAYGREGGGKYIEEKLRIKEDNFGTAKKVRKSIEQCFEKVNGFLLPRIADPAIESDFDGSIEAVGPKFANKMEEFINWLVTEKIHHKSIIGTVVTGEVFLDYMEKYVEIFNKHPIPSALSLWEATTIVPNSNALKEAVNKFGEKLTDFQNGKEYLHPTSFDDYAEIAKQAAFQHFNDNQIDGDNENWKSSLKQQITGEHSKYKLENHERRQKFLTWAKKQTEDIFREKFTDILPNGDNNFIEPDDLQKTGTDATHNALEFYSNTLSLETRQEKGDALTIMKAAFSTTISSSTNENYLKQERAYKQCDRLVEDLTENFQNNINPCIYNDCFPDRQSLNQRIQQEKENILEEFNNGEMPGNNNATKNRFRTKLDQKMKTVTNDMVSCWTQRQSEKNQSLLENQLKEARENYHQMWLQHAEQQERLVKQLTQQQQDESIAKSIAKGIARELAYLAVREVAGLAVNGVNMWYTGTGATNLAGTAATKLAETSVKETTTKLVGTAVKETTTKAVETVSEGVANVLSEAHIAGTGANRIAGSVGGGMAIGVVLAGVQHYMGNGGPSNMPGKS